MSHRASRPPLPPGAVVVRGERITCGTCGQECPDGECKHCGQPEPAAPDPMGGLGVNAPAHCADCGTAYNQGVPGCSCAAPAVLGLGDRRTVDLSDAYGHALSGNGTLAVVAALFGAIAALDRINATLKRIADATAPVPTVRLNLAVQLTDKGDSVAISQTVNPALNDLQFTISPTQGGAPASPAGPVSWSSSNPGVVALEPAADGLSCKGRVNSVGVCTVTVTDGTANDECQVIAEGSAPGPVVLNIGAQLIGKGE